MACAVSLNILTPTLLPTRSPSEPASLRQLLSTLNMLPHPEGGYYVETDRDRLRIPNPFMPTNNVSHTNTTAAAVADIDTTRSASTSIFYLLTPHNPIGHFHRNKARTIHTLHRGRGVYVLIHADEAGQQGEGMGGAAKARVETFVVGPDVLRGERLQWIVEGGKFKASFLLPDDGREGGSDGLLISETVVPGFEFTDHDFMRASALRELTTDEQCERLSWLLSDRA